MKTLLLVSSACLALPAAAQSTISAANHQAYGANTGWIDFRTSAADGVRVMETCLSGKAYAANFGWIDFGDGTPVNGYNYSNASAADYGVNFSADGTLTGYAWASNIGWINFEQTQGKPQVNLITGKLTGYAWSTNTGWISLDTTPTDLVTSIARPDTDGDGIGDAWEMQNFGNLTAANGSTNFDGDPQSDREEYEANTAPKNATEYLRIVSHSHSNGAISSSIISFTSNAGRLYRIEYTPDFQPPWTNSTLFTFAPDPGTSTTKNFVRSSGPNMFFRVVSVKPLP